MSSSHTCPTGTSGGSAGATMPVSASAIVAQAVPVSGSHVLRIEGYSLTKGLGTGSCITSRTFAAGGHRWCLQYYPNGYDYDDDGFADPIYISILLCLDPAEAGEVRARYKISLLDQAGHPAPSYSRSSVPWTFSSIKEVVPVNCRYFITVKDLEGSVYLKDDAFSVRCDVTVVRELEESAHLRGDVFGDVRCVTMDKQVFTERVPAFVVVPPPDMHRHLALLLADGDGADVTFEVGAERFAAHRWMLAARSPVFKSELVGAMKENSTDALVRVDDVEAKVFKAMLHFVYTDTLPRTDGDDDDDVAAMAQHLLVVADRYGLERLKAMCEDTLRGGIDATTAATTLALAEQHRCRGLKDACFKFLASPGNFKAVMAGDGFEHLIRSCPSLLKELVANLAI